MKIKNIFFKTKARIIALTMLAIGGGWYWGREYARNFLNIDNTEVSEEEIIDTFED